MPKTALNLAPARWIWWPSQRTLPNTFVLFRRPFAIRPGLIRVTGWVSADSRYLLTLDGQRVQWGPAPCDPRTLDVDPVELSATLSVGMHVLGLEVLYFGHGEGTWVGGKPGVICRLELEYADGSQEVIATDRSWQALLDRSHPPGHYQRWFLRALQEECDLRLRPGQWDTSAFTPDASWLPAMELDIPASMPPAFGSYPDWLTDANYAAANLHGTIGTENASGGLQARAIPLLRESICATEELIDAGIVHWQRDPRDWFETRTPGSFVATSRPSMVSAGEQGWTVDPPDTPSSGVYLTFSWTEQMVGWPLCLVEASEGTIIELITQEAHDPQKTLWLDSHFFTWSRFTCHDGVNILEPFDFDSLRWLQLHIHHTTSPVRIRQVALRRRSYPWQHFPCVTTDDPALQQLFRACINTLVNSAQETLVDGMGRERQQYSGDGGHQTHAIRALFGETKLPARYLHTFSAGQTPDGYFLDCWPGVDRLVRTAQRLIGATPWGPLLDHGVGFVFDCWHHLLETGDLASLSIPYPRLIRFARWLADQIDERALLPVERLGIPSVWLDHDAFVRQRHKQCAFTLYSAAMYLSALAPLAECFGEEKVAAWSREIGQQLLTGAHHQFWDHEDGLFVANLPWLEEEGERHLDDRSLATALFFDFCPQGVINPSLTALAKAPSSLGLSYPPNAFWRYRALAKWGRMDIVLQDLRARWAQMPSVEENCTIAEHWQAQPDSAEQWSHCGVVPLNLAWMEMAGIQPLRPGYSRYRIRPQLSDVGGLELSVWTPHGPLSFRATQASGGHHIEVETPPQVEGVFQIMDWQQCRTSGEMRKREQHVLAPGGKHVFWLPL